MKRYNLKHGPDHVSELVENENGQYIKYTDFMKIMKDMEKKIDNAYYEGIGIDFDEENEENNV